jgi:hypothetical protein
MIIKCTLTSHWSRFADALGSAASPLPIEPSAKIKGDYISMRINLTLSALLLLISGNVLAGSEYDNCVKEQNTLKTEEASNCSGLNYLFNPSACFATRRVLKEYISTGKCKKIGISENVNFSVPPVIPAKKAGSVSKVDGVNPAVVKKPESEVPQQESTCEQLKDENTRLKTEINRLKAENEQLRKTGH